MIAGQISTDLLAAVVAIQRQFIIETDPRAAFEQALRLFVELSESKLGFIGEVLQSENGEPYLKMYATSGVDCNESAQAFYDAYAPEGMEFHNLRNLMGAVICTCEPIISNAPDVDPRSGGLPPGHPVLDSFLGLPIFSAEGKLAGMAGLANRSVGYDDEQVAMFKPLCDALGVMIVAAQRERQRSHAEAALRASETRFQTFVDHVTDGLFLQDENARVVDVNRRAYESLGYEREELLGLHPTDFDCVVKAADVEARMARLADGETIAFDSRHRRKDGSEFPVEIRVRPLWVDGKLYTLALACDITERTRAEKAIRQSTQLLENIVENIPLAVFVKDPHDQFRVRLWNKSSEAIFGIRREEMIGRNAFDYWPKEQAEFFHSIDQKVIEEGKFQDVVEESSTLYGQETKIIRTRKLPLVDSEGKPSLLLAICEDITAQKRSEEALRETQQRLALILKGADVGLWDWNLDTNVVNYSAEWKGQLGYRDDELLDSYDDWATRVHPDDFPATLAKVNEAIESCSADYSSEFRMRHRDGSWRWILALGFVIGGPNGKPARMLGVHIDITARKQVEDALRESERRYRLVSELSSSFSYQTTIGDDDEVTFNWVGGKFGEVTGYSPEELSGRSWMRVIHPEDLDRVRSLIESMRTVPPQEFYELEHRIIARSGEERWIRSVMHPMLPYIPGKPLTTFGAVLDITERKQSEVAVRESEARLRTMLENLDRVAVQSYEPDGTITFWNKASELFYGYTADEAMGRDLVELLHGEQTRDEERRIMAEALRTGETLSADEVGVVRRDGTKMTVFASRIVHARPGKPPEFFCFVVDITDRKRAEEELAARQAELLHASRLTTVGQMVAELSHEVAQPLSAIGNFAAASERILDSLADPKLQTLHEYVRAIVKQNQRCVAILDRLRDYSRRSSAGQCACDLSELLRESADLFASELRRSQVRVRFELANGLPAVSVDRIQLQQVIVNLLTNARDAMLDKVPDRRAITIRTFAEEDGVVFEVEDRGSGLSEEVAAHLFDPFFTTKEHGMGIGLSICQSIMKDHGGKIEAISNSHGGATFRVRLPLVRGG